MGPIDPVQALDRIAYLLERSREPTYRVRAFRNASAAARKAGSEELARLAEAGRLTSLKGIGDSTAKVIAEALAGQVPSYLTKLEEAVGPVDEERQQLDQAANALLQALKGDCHTHSDWSDGGSPVDEMARAARDLGHDYLVLTDHSPRLTVAHGLDATRLRQQLELVSELNATLAPFRILTGIEVDILEDGALDQERDLLRQLDVVVASVHSKLRMDGEGMTARMLRAVEDPDVDILGHCTGRIMVGRGRPPSEFDAAAVFGACAASGTAVEINSRPERLDPPEELLATARDVGCLFSIDTDAHAPGQLEWQPYGAEKAAGAGIGPDRIINAWDADRLLAWTAAGT